MRACCKPIALGAMLVVAMVAATGCGGGTGASGLGDLTAAADSAGTGPAPAAGLPTSALQSVTGLLAWAGDMVNTRGDTAPPIALGDATLPADDTAAPGPTP
jgi:hypothetical protein